MLLIMAFSILAGAGASSQEPGRGTRPTKDSKQPAFSHPGISHSQASIAFVKAAIAAGQEPWATAWEQVQESRYAALDWRPQPCAHVERGPSNNPNIGFVRLQR